MWVLQYSKNTFFTDHLWATASAQIDPDKIVNYFFVKSCLRTVDQHYTGKFLVQFWLTHIKTTLYMVIFLRKDDYKLKQLFANAFQNRVSLFTGKHLCWSLSLIKLLGWRSATLVKRDLNTGVFLWIIRNS